MRVKRKALRTMPGIKRWTDACCLRSPSRPVRGGAGLLCSGHTSDLRGCRRSGAHNRPDLVSSAPRRALLGVCLHLHGHDFADAETGTEQPSHLTKVTEPQIYSQVWLQIQMLPKVKQANSVGEGDPA